MHGAARRARPGAGAPASSVASSRPTIQASRAASRPLLCIGIATVSRMTATRSTSPAARAWSRALSGSPLASSQSVARRSSSGTSSGSCSPSSARNSSRNAPCWRNHSPARSSGTSSRLGASDSSRSAESRRSSRASQSGAESRSRIDVRLRKSRSSRVSASRTDSRRSCSGEWSRSRSEVAASSTPAGQPPSVRTSRSTRPSAMVTPFLRIRRRASLGVSASSSRPSSSSAPLARRRGIDGSGSSRAASAIVAPAGRCRTSMVTVAAASAPRRWASSITSTKGSAANVAVAASIRATSVAASVSGRVEGQERKRAAVPRGPLCEQRRLAVAGRSDDADDGERPGRPETVDERGPRDGAASGPGGEVCAAVARAECRFRRFVRSRGSRGHRASFRAGPLLARCPAITHTRAASRRQRITRSGWSGALQRICGFHAVGGSASTTVPVSRAGRRDALIPFG